MSSNFFLGNPSSKITAWLSSNSSDAQKWDFDVSKTTIGFKMNLAGNQPAQDIQMGPDDNTLIICSRTGVFSKYTMTDGELSSAVLAQQTEATKLMSFKFTKDGKTLLGVAGGAFHGQLSNLYRFTKKITLPAAWDLSQIPVMSDEYVQQTNVGINSPFIDNIFDNGKTVFLNNVSISIKKLALDPAYDLSEPEMMQQAGRAEMVHDPNAYITGFQMSDDGRKIYVTAANGTIYHYVLDVPFDISEQNLTFVGSKMTISWAGQFAINNAGTKMYVLDGSAFNKITEFNLSK